MISPEAKAEIEHWLKKFPPEQRQSAVIPALKAVQKDNGWLSREMMDSVAAYLGMSPIAVYEVASFYTLFDTSPVGRHKIAVCTNISCMLRNCDDIVQHLKKRLGIDWGQTTPDGRFTLQEVECLAACGGAPAMQIAGDCHENLTLKKVDAILDALE